MEKWSPVDKIRGYTVFGGLPAYLSIIDDSIDLYENIYKHILNPSSFLHHDPLYMLSIETREPDRYLAILSAIANGRQRVGEIASDTGLPLNIVSKYLYVLEKALGIVEKIYPLGFEGKKKYSRYIIKDNYYRFWFSTIYPRLGDPAIHTREYLDRVKGIVDQQTPLVWEEVAREHMQILREDKKIAFTRIGKWWYKGLEIDLVALDDESRTAYFIECKWSKKPLTRKHIESLREKAIRTTWRNWSYKYIFYTLTEPETYPEDVTVYTLDDVEKDFDKRKPLVTQYTLKPTM